MTHVVILGSSNAVATDGHENTHLAVVGRERTILVDCVGSPVVRLERAGIALTSVSDIILTHFHPDHVSAIPLLLMDMWLLDRQKPIMLHGLAYTLDRIETMMDLFGSSKWPGFYPVKYHRLEGRELESTVTTESFRILCSPVRHLIPTIGIRIESRDSGKVLAYSCDTEPCPEVVHLAGGADVLLHEAAGEARGHSSAAQAGEIAQRAEAYRLVLIHYATGKHAHGDPRREAAAAFSGEITLAEDLMEFELT